MEYRKSKAFSSGLIKVRKKEVDQLWQLTSLYNSAMSYCANRVRIYLILMSMTVHNYQQLVSLEESTTKIEGIMEAIKKG